MEHPWLQSCLLGCGQGWWVGMYWPSRGSIWLVSVHAVQLLNILNITPEYCGCDKPVGNEIISVRKHLAIPVLIYLSPNWVRQWGRQIHKQIPYGKSWANAKMGVFFKKLGETRGGSHSLTWGVSGTLEEENDIWSGSWKMSRSSSRHRAF